MKLFRISALTALAALALTVSCGKKEKKKAAPVVPEQTAQPQVQAPAANSEDQTPAAAPSQPTESAQPSTTTNTETAAETQTEVVLTEAQKIEAEIKSFLGDTPTEQYEEALEQRLNTEKANLEALKATNTESVGEEEKTAISAQIQNAEALITKIEQYIAHTKSTVVEVVAPVVETPAATEGSETEAASNVEEAAASVEAKIEEVAPEAPKDPGNE